MMSFTANLAAEVLGLHGEVCLRAFEKGTLAACFRNAATDEAETMSNSQLT